MRVRHAVLGVLLAALLPPQPSLAASCSFDPDSGTVSVTFRRHVGVVRDGDALLVGRKPCGDATVTNTDLIRFIALKGQRAVRLNLSGGPFAPGLTDEGDGSSEIEFDATAGSGAAVIVRGTAETDNFVAGYLGVNLNAGEPSEDLDVKSSTVLLHGRGGSDFLSGDGSAATGLGSSVVGLRGGPGDDTLVADRYGAGTYGYQGGWGWDSLDYSNVRCPIEVNAMFQVFGCPTWESYDIAVSIEEMIGTPFDDSIEGSSGNEVLRGRGGDDFLHGRRGRDLLDGGSRTDTCMGGGGGDTLIRCEA